MPPSNYSGLSSQSHHSESHTVLLCPLHFQNTHNTCTVEITVIRIISSSGKCKPKNNKYLSQHNSDNQAQPEALALNPEVIQTGQDIKFNVLQKGVIILST